MRWWAEKDVKTLQDIAKTDGEGWKTFSELRRLWKTSVALQLYTRVVQSVPWTTNPMPTFHRGQWIAAKEVSGSIQIVYHLQNTAPMEANIYSKQGTE